MSEREDAVARILQHHNTTDPRQLPALAFLEACQPGFRARLDRMLADRGLALDGTNTIVKKETS